MPHDLNSVSSSSRATARRGAVEELAQLRDDVVGADALLLDGAQVVAGLVERGLAPVDEESCRRHGLRADLPRPPVREGSCRIDVRPRRQPAQLHDRIAGGRRRADDVGSVERLLDGCRHERVRLQGECLRVGRIAAPDADDRVLEHGLHRVDVRASLHAGAEHRHRARSGPGEQLRRDGRDGCRPDLGDRRRVEDGESAAR